MTQIIFKKALTHSGIFHADDVFSTALVMLLWPEIVIERVTKVDWSAVSEDTIVYDIGLGEFDHHQKNNECRPNGIPYAAFGKLWRAFGRNLCLSERAWEEVEATLVEPLDYTDNTGEKNPLSFAIRHMNPTWDSEKTPDEAFFDAVKVALPILEAAIDTANSKDRASKVLKENSHEEGNGVLVLDRFMPWYDEVITGMPWIYMVVYPSDRGGFCIHVVPSKLHTESSDEVRVPFPKEWYSSPATELGMTFCHKSGFAVANTKEEAVNIAQEAIYRYLFDVV